jgi:proteasome lid subunit RPN8/RPN11
MKIGLRRKKKKKHIRVEWKIKKKCLDLISECARSNYPNEFMGLMRVDKTSKDTITEIIILPGTISGDSHAIIQLHMLPINYSIVGTVHSHPSSSPKPSGADFALFTKYGRIHIITATPYNENSWRAYDHHGNEIEIKVV